MPDVEITERFQRDLSKIQRKIQSRIDLDAECGSVILDLSKGKKVGTPIGKGVFEHRLCQFQGYWIRLFYGVCREENPIFVFRLIQKQSNNLSRADMKSIFDAWKNINRSSNPLGRRK